MNPAARLRPLLLSALAAAVLCGGCSGPEVAFNSRYEFSKLRRVAVASFEGSGGAAAADYLSHALLASGADVVERSRLEAVLNEQNLRARGVLDPETVRRVGKILGVDAVFLGSVTEYAPQQSYLIVTDSSANYIVAGAAPVGSGTRFTNTPAFGAPGTSILTSSAQVGLTARLVDVESGSVVWSAHQSYEGFDLDSAMSAVTVSFARTLSHVWRP